MKKQDLTQGNIFKLLLLVAIPNIIAGLLQFTYSIVDMLILGRLVGDSAIAGVGSAALFIGYGTSIIFLVVNGLGVKIAHSIGADSKEEYYKYLNAGYLLYFIITTFFFVLFTFFTDFLLSFLEINGADVYNNAKMYLRVYGFVCIFAFINTIYTRIMLSSGLSKVNMKINGTGVIINIILDYVLIAYFDLHILGAVLATLIAQMTVTVLFLVKNSNGLLPKKTYGLHKEYVKNIFSLGLPYSIQRVFFTIIGMLVAKSLISFGDEAMAAQRLGFQIETVTLLVIGGLLSSTSAFVGQNFGADKYDRIPKAFNIALIIGESYAFITSVIFLLFAENIVDLFLTDPDAIKYAAMYLRFVAVGQFFGVFEMIGNGFYNGIGKPKIPSIISITITPLRLVFAMYLSPIYGLYMIYVGILVTTILKGVISYGYYQLVIKKQIGTTIVSKRK